MDTPLSIVSTALLLLFILDPFGNVAVLIALLKGMDNRSRYRVIIRETLIGLLILLFFLFVGDRFLQLFGLETEAVGLAGGLILFIIGFRMIFPDKSGVAVFSSQDPFIVPIALPMIAGPSALATLVLLSHNHPNQTFTLVISLLIAWFISAVILLLAPFMYRVLRRRGLVAMERLMGMLLLIMSIQMFIDGFRSVFGIGK